ncbi:uncharacterized protein [Ptychodera flava]|uniref:uncharacterized protein n=1 Tax=Ptychodera flava TaxID=63121 RepID=UPI003969F4A8
MYAGTGDDPKMERELLCVICMNFYEEPLLLQCGHTFCKKCLQDLLSKSPQLNRSNDAVSNRRSTCEIDAVSLSEDKIGEPRDGEATQSIDNTGFRCPTCRRQFDPNLGNLVRNLLLESIVECFKEQKQTRQSKTTIVCDVCSDADGRQATTKCLQCKVLYCEQCLGLCHPNKGVFTRHTLVSVSNDGGHPFAKERLVNCHIHNDEKLKLYCEQCNVPICYVCDRTGSHQGHEVIESIDAYRNIRAKIDDDLSALVNMKEAIEKFVTTLQETGESIQNEAKTLKDTISQNCKELVAIIAERERAMLDCVSEEMTVKLCHIQDKMTTCKEKLQSTKGLVEYTEKVLEETNDSQAAIFLSSAKSLQNRLQTCLGKCPCLEIATNDRGFDDLVLNFRDTREEVLKLETKRTEVPKAPKITSARVVDRNTVVLSLKHPQCDVKWYEVCCRYGESSFDTIQCLVDSPPEGVSEEYHIHLGNLDFNSEYILSASVTNVAGKSPQSESVSVKTHPEATYFGLDSSTAHESLMLSEGGKSVSRRNSYQHPVMTVGEKVHAGERFIRRVHCVLGDVTLSEGEHYWEVEANSSGATTYAIGVAKRQCDRNAQLGTDSSSWCIEIMGVTLRAYHDDRSYSIDHQLTSSSVHNFSVYLNFERGHVIFYDTTAEKLLYRFQFGEAAVSDSGICPAFDLTNSRAKLTVITNKTVPEFVNTHKSNFCKLSTMGDSLEGELSCAVCMDIYTDPRLLPCAHSFCRTCLFDVMKKGHPEKKSASSRLSCPSCRHEADLDKRGVDGLPKNFLLESIVIRFKETKCKEGRSSREKGVGCDICAETEGTVAVKTCIQCGVSYCESCLRSYHPNKGVFTKHKLVKATKNPRQKDVYCPEHEDELIKMYCVKCKTPVCYLCDRFGGHKGHPVAELKASYKQMKATLSNNLDQLVVKTTDVSVFIKDLEKKSDSVQINATILDQRISEEFKIIFEMLKRREEEMHARVSMETNRKRQCLQQQIISFQDKLHSTAGLIEYTREVLKEEQPAALLLTGASLDDRLKTTILSCPPLQPNATEDFSHMILNLKNEKEMIEKIDLITIKAPEKPRIGGRIEGRNTASLTVKHSQCMVESYEVGVCKSGAQWGYHKEECTEDKEVDEYHLVKSNLDFDSEYFAKARLRNKAGTSGWSNVLTLRTPPKVVTFKLDPHTAHEDLVITNGGKSVTYQPRPRGFWVMDEGGKHDSGRFNGRAPALFGDVALTGDVYYWEVSTAVAEKVNSSSVGYRGDFAVGVAKFNCDRNMSLGNDSSSWVIRVPSSGGNWYIAHKNKQYPINSASVSDSCPRSHFPAGLTIGIMLDFQKHKLSFYDCNKKLLLYSLEITSKEKKLCPVFEISDGQIQLTVKTGLVFPEFTK